MTALALIPSRARDLDLALLAVTSLRTYAPGVRTLVIVTDDPGGRVFPPQGMGPLIRLPHRDVGTRAHAAAIHHARNVGHHLDAEYVVLMDNDAMVRASAWWLWVLDALKTHAVVGGAHHDGVVHPCLMAMPMPWFDRIPTFASSTYENGWTRGQPWRDTAGMACDYVVEHGGRLAMLPGRMTPEGWTEYGYGHPAPALWAHLGSGTQSHHVALLRYPLAALGHRSSLEQRARVARRHHWVQDGWQRLNTLVPATARARA